MENEPYNFFALSEPYSKIEDADNFWSLLEDDVTHKIENYLYHPDDLESKKPPRKWRIRDKQFRNFSFAKTHISLIEFSNCQFENCLFIGATIEDCRFNNCDFVECNFFRCQIQNCFIDPKGFDKCTDRVKFANIGLGLYHELLHNSRQQTQPDFTRYAQYQFRKWQRYVKLEEISKSKDSYFKKWWKYLTVFPDWVFEKTTGSGMRLRNLTITSILVLLVLTFVNYYFKSSFGLMLGKDPVKSITEAFYFSTIVVTTLGFGDITPTTDIGRVIIALEAIVGFITFALLVSMAFRRITN